MIAYELISKVLTPLKPGETGEEALTIMNIYHVKHLPVVEKGKLIGVVSEKDILSRDLSDPVDILPYDKVKHYVYKNDHLFEVMGKMGQLNLSSISVVDEDENYLGIITMEDLLQFYANSFSFKEPGSIIVLERKQMDYSLADISRIVESENAHILSSFLTKEPDSDVVLVTIKLNVHNVQRIIASLERHDYTVTAKFTEEDYFQGLKERYDALMRYLSV